MPRLFIDRTVYVGPLYLGILGSLAEYFALGVAIRFSRNVWMPFGKSVSIHLAFWTITIGWEAPDADWYRRLASSATGRRSP